MKTFFKFLFMSLPKGIFKFFYKLSSCLVHPFATEGLKKPSAIVSTVILIPITFLWIIPALITFSYDVVAFNFLKKTDTFIFSKAEMIEGETDLFKVYACKKTPCRAQLDTVEFRIRDSFYMDLTWLFAYGQPYDPSELAGSFLAQKNVCKVEYYGRRVKHIGWYPKIINAECEQ